MARRLVCDTGRGYHDFFMLPDEHRVFCARAPLASYAPYPGIECPELPGWAGKTTALVSLRSLLHQAGLDRSRAGSPEWNPLGDIVRDGERVVLKPNWVRDRNGSGEGLDCLVTHTHLIEAILHYVAKARPRSIVIGDEPVQGCNFDRLLADCRVPAMIETFRAHGVEVAVKDFRRTILENERLGERGLEECRPLEEFVLFDLGRESVLEPVSTADSEFRVTMYHPDWLKRTHGPGRHQYLVARDIIEADIVINVPKLKTHKKACVTGALKNIVGINGHKEYLPHHRKGGSAEGGDCYPGRSRVKRLIEDLLDATNRARSLAARRILAHLVRAGMGIARTVGVDDNYEGSWYGNDTVWRMSLDLQRVLLYGASDGRLSEGAQRRVLTITDAIIAGEGDGPLSPSPVAFGMMTLASSTAAADWVHALLMGLDPGHIPLIREAFTRHRYPLARF